MCSWTPDGVPGTFSQLLKDRLGTRDEDSCAIDWGDAAGTLTCTTAAGPGANPTATTPGKGSSRRPNQ